MSFDKYRWINKNKKNTHEGYSYKKITKQKGLDSVIIEAQFECLKKKSQSQTSLQNSSLLTKEDQLKDSIAIQWKCGDGTTCK